MRQGSHLHHTLSSDEREVIVTSVPLQNNHRYCLMVHDAIAARHRHDKEDSSFR